VFRVNPVLLGVGMAGIVGVIAGIVAIYHFEWFLLLTLASRSSMDLFNRSNGLDPGFALGAVFLLAGGLWLLARRRSGQWLRPSAPVQWLTFFVFACLLSSLSASEPLTSMTSSLKVASGAMMFAVLDQYLGQYPGRVRHVVNAVFASLALPAVIGFYQVVTDAGNHDVAGVNRVYATFAHPTSLSEYLIMVLSLAVPLFIVQRRSKNAWVLLSIVAIALMLVLSTYTRTAWLAVIACAIYVGIRLNRRILVWLVAGAVFLAVVAPSVVGRFSDLSNESAGPDIPANSLDWRVQYWGTLLELSEEQRLTGIGFDMAEVVTPDKLEPHNIYVEAVVETGVLGLVALCGFIASLASSVRRRLRDAEPGIDGGLATAAMFAGVALLVMSVTENLITQPVLYFYAAAAMTVGYSPRSPRPRRNTWR
jgi:putative inorganic carbon (HCO3(-)) transporter